jgi:hypothetical protein
MRKTRALALAYPAGFLLRSSFTSWAKRRLLATPAGDGFMALAVCLAEAVSVRMRVIKGPRMLCVVMATSFCLSG